MMPPDWGNLPEKPICPVCACVQFSEEFICLGCGEPLVVRPYVTRTVKRVIAADRWGKHWPADYERRCFVCGWKSRKSLDSLAPKKPEELMAAGIWSTQPAAQKLAQIVCPDRTLSERFKLIIGVLSRSEENALFKTVAHNDYAKMAQKFEGRKLSFCRHCAEKDAQPKPVEAPAPNSVSLTETMAQTMAKPSKGSSILSGVIAKVKEAHVNLVDIKLPMIAYPEPPMWLAPQPDKHNDGGDWGFDEEDWHAAEQKRDYGDIYEAVDEDKDEEEDEGIEEEDYEDIYDGDEDGDDHEDEPEDQEVEKQGADGWGEW